MKNKINYFFRKFMFLKALNSPFKPFKFKWYIGKIAIGTPYFFPRKWVKLSEKEIEEKAQEKYNKLSESDKSKTTLEHYKQYYKGFTKSVPKKTGFDFVELGWKTKWDDYDYRHEWSPIWSFVLFKWQIAIIFNEPTFHYWECWLAYELSTDKTKSPKERIKQAKEIFPCKWISYENGKEIHICYWDKILK